MCTPLISERYVVPRWHVVGHGLYTIHHVNINYNGNDLSEAIHLSKINNRHKWFRMFFSGFHSFS